MSEVNCDYVCVFEHLNDGFLSFNCQSEDDVVIRGGKLFHYSIVSERKECLNVPVRQCSG